MRSLLSRAVSSRPTKPSPLVSKRLRPSAKSTVGICVPAWFWPKPQPFTYNVSSSMLATDFISHASPRTHHSCLPSAIEYEVSWNDSGIRICAGPVFGRQIVGVE